MKRADQITGILVLLFSGFVIEESLRIPQESVVAGRTEFAPVPGFLPFWAGVILAGMALLLLLGSFKRREWALMPPFFPLADSWARVLIAFVSLIAYLLLLWLKVRSWAGWSILELTRLVQNLIMERRNLWALLCPRTDDPPDHGQLNLFNLGGTC